jgi:protein O-GlcNAc transferase
LACHQQGDLKQAEINYLKILNFSPENADALHLLGVLSNQKQDFTAAFDLISRALQIVPRQPIFHSNLANALRDSGRCEQAIAAYQKALQLKPDLFETHINMGIAYDQLAKFDSAVSAYQKAISLKPDSADAYYNLGNSFKEQRLEDKAIDCYRQAIAINPLFAEAYYNLAIVLERQANDEAAIDCLKQCLRIHPQWAEAYNNLGNLCKRQDLHDQALAHYQQAVQLKPQFYVAQNNLGNALKDLGCWPEAIACYQEALRVQPQYAEAYLNLGITLAESDRPVEAVDHFQAAVCINPDFAAAHNYLGITLADLGKHGEAIDCFERAIEINPDYSEAYCYLIYQLQYICDWSRLETASEKLDQLIGPAAPGGQFVPQPPFIHMTRHPDPEHQLINARAWCRKMIPPARSGIPLFPFDRRHLKTGKLTIGYLSGDFHDHATAHLMLGVFGLHNRSKLQINCYSYGPDDHSAYRAQIRQQSDLFVDLRELSHIDAARRIYADEVDILVDLKGHTRGARLGILASRPAPIQVHYLGFPGTTGADFIDYLITDRIVTPVEHASYYSEKLVYLPHSYQVNDQQQKIAPCDWTRKDWGLPDQGFVFSSFNLPYKIDSLMFDCWMRILNRIPDSVLWLFSPGAQTIHHLKQEAGHRGVDPRRLVFADKLPKVEHLARLQLADLALDTRMVNGHTTTSDSLWAGVPVITLEGTHFASRVSASLLNAIGLPELIAANLGAYERLAIHLAMHSEALIRIKAKLAHNRLTQPLFDTSGFVDYLEAAYQKMGCLFREGQKPQQFEIPAG